MTRRNNLYFGVLLTAIFITPLSLAAIAVIMWSSLKRKVYVSNQAIRVIHYDDRIRSSDLLQSLGWDTLHVRWAKLKSVLLYKILNENYSPCLRDTLVRLRDLNRQYNLRNHDMDLALPKPKTNF